jgi:hypothetical protein
MNWSLQIDVPKHRVPLNHGDHILLLGSCFSDNLHPYFESAGFNVLSNPLGTIFHPIAIANGIFEAFDNSGDTYSIQRDDVWLDWQASSKLYGTTKEELLRKKQQQLSRLKKSLEAARVVVVTFGTAWGYALNSGTIVANCHKMPSEQFSKRLSCIDDMYLAWKEVIANVKDINSNVSFVFTVSPVRHIRDGLVDNTRSKSRLIELAHLLAEEEEAYFPAFEIVNDVLRDYRFFGSDLVHPNNQAIQYVWEFAKEFFFAPQTLQDVIKVERFHKMLEHIPLFPDSKAAAEFHKQRNEKRQEIEKSIPYVRLKEDKNKNGLE